jgi:phosphate transport system substrate-binding protein
MYLRRVCVIIAGGALAGVLAFPAAPSTLQMGGTGAATEPLRQIGATFTAKTGIPVEVVPGLGSAGGISALAEGVLQLAVSGRPLSPAEEVRELTTVRTICTPYVLASSHPAPGSLDSTAIAAIYANAAPQWSDGMPIRIVLRPKAESDNATLVALFPGMEQGLAQARTRDTVPVGATDQDNADLAEQIPGSLIGATYAQLLSEHRPLRLVAINGTLPGADAMESGRYPFRKSLYLISARHPPPEATDFVRFLNSPDGGQAMRTVGILACAK